MKNLFLILMLVATASGCGKKLKGVCTQIESSNDLEVCDFQQATIVLSKAGQSVITKQTPAPVAQATPVSKGK